VHPVLQYLLFVVAAFVLLSGISYAVARRRAGAGGERVTSDASGLADLDGLRARARRTYAIAAKRRSHLSLILIDLDHLARYNELYGQAAGDMLIAGAADALRRSLRREDGLAKTGGQQFGVVLAVAPAVAQQIAERLLTALRNQPHRIDTGMLKITASAGVASVPAHARTVDALFACAVAALRAAKAEGRNRVAVFDPARHAPAATGAAARSPVDRL